MERPEDERLPALDGLRGLAAVVVLLSHVVMAGVGAISLTVVVGGDPDGLAWWFTRTPLATVWAGPEAVVVFFVLSGFVLTRALRARPVPVPAFVAGRAIRLYLPVWASLAVSAAIIALVPRAPGYGGVGGNGAWLDTYARAPGPATVARDMALVLSDRVGTVGTLNGVLWSLRWEVLFCLALPLLVAASGTIRRLAVPVVVAALLCCLLGTARPILVNAPPFAIGVVLALHEARLRRWRTELGGRGAPVAVGLAACLLSADLWLPGAARGAGRGEALVLAGATLAVLLPLVYPAVARALCTRPMRWLGSRSFSLYLVHFPILLAFAYGLDAPPFITLLATVLPTSLLAAELFHRAVERPCHRLARQATAQVATRWTSAPAPAPAAAPA